MRNVKVGVGRCVVGAGIGPLVSACRWSYMSSMSSARGRRCLARAGYGLARTSRESIEVMPFWCARNAYVGCERDAFMRGGDDADCAEVFRFNFFVRFRFAARLNCEADPCSVED